jgi:hypothetical protein
MTLRMAGFNSQKHRGSLTKLMAKRVSSNLSPWSNLGRLVLIPMKEREERGHLLPLRPTAAMAGLRCSPENFDFPDFNHQTTHSLHQSMAELNTNTSMRLRTSMTDRGWSAARDDGGAMASSLETRKPTIRSTKNLKKSMGRKREGWQSHQSKEKRRGKNSKLHRWKAAKHRVLNSLSSNWRCSARSYGRKREEGKRGYTFIAPKRDDYGWKS